METALLTTQINASTPVSDQFSHEEGSRATPLARPHTPSPFATRDLDASGSVASLSTDHRLAPTLAENSTPISDPHFFHELGPFVATAANEWRDDGGHPLVTDMLANIGYAAACGADFEEDLHHSLAVNDFTEVETIASCTHNV